MDSIHVGQQMNEIVLHQHLYVGFRHCFFCALQCLTSSLCQKKKQFSVSDMKQELENTISTYVRKRELFFSNTL